TFNLKGTCNQYHTPSVKELVKILYSGKRFGNHVDEVWPNLFLGDIVWKLGITHGGPDFYGPSVVYYGVPADDSATFDLSKYFTPAAEFIHKSLEVEEGRVLVHCAVGVSRSATLVLSFLMMHHRLPLVDAILTVKQRRWIFPNHGFLKQLRSLDIKLHTPTL
uniref:Dual specificity protein phosphatase n=1 Tax=Neogobius melanostomus TaxID=47308 RepID=A0A8C6TNN8_9GOBI